MIVVLRRRMRKRPSSPPCPDIQLTPSPSSLTSSPRPPDSLASFQQRFQHFQPELLQQRQEEEESGVGEEQGQEGKREGRVCQCGVSVHYSISYSTPCPCNPSCHPLKLPEPSGLQLQLPLPPADPHLRPAEPSGLQLEQAKAPADHQLRGLYSPAEPSSLQGNRAELGLRQQQAVLEGCGRQGLCSGIPGSVVEDQCSVISACVPGQCSVIPACVPGQCSVRPGSVPGRCSVIPGSDSGHYLSMLKENLVEGARSQRRDSLVCDV